MSVTFTLAIPYEPCKKHLGYCECSEFAGWNYCEHIAISKAECDCERFDVNVSNTNARALLERLGVSADEDLCGTMDADEFLGRALVGNVGRDDSGIEDARYRGERGATIVHCGVDAGYFSERLDQLVALATEAKRLGVGVHWA